MLDLFREIYQTLRNNKLRTFLTGFAVAWGIFMLIILLGMAYGVQKNFQNSRGNKGTNVVNVYNGRTSKAFAGYKEGRRIQLKDKDTDILESENKNHVEDVTAWIQGGSSIISTPHDYISSHYMGVFPKYIEISGNEMQAGRFINDADMQNQRKVMVLTRKNANILFEDTTKVVGQKVTMNNISFTVIGVYDPEWGEDTYIPFTTAKMLAGGSDNVDNLTVSVKNLKTIEDGKMMEDEIFNTLGAVHSFDPTDKSSLWIWNRFTQYLNAQQGLDILQIVIWLIGILTMLSGIVGVSNIMFVSVKERTHEIGIRRAIGAKPRHILTQILTESIAITTLFGYFGIFFGIIVLEGIAALHLEGIGNPTIDIKIAIYVTLVLIFAGSLAGLFPALRALKIKPVEALRDE